MLKITYKLRGAGWADCDVTDGTQVVALSASYLSDALGALAQATTDIVKGEMSAIASFLEEPGEYRWVLTRNDDRVTVEIFEFAGFGDVNPSGGKVIFKSDITVEEFKKSVVDCLETVLNTYTLEEYKEKWVRHEFPMEALEDLKNS